MVQNATEKYLEWKEDCGPFDAELELLFDPNMPFDTCRNPPAAILMLTLNEVMDIIDHSQLQLSYCCLEERPYFTRITTIHKGFFSHDERIFQARLLTWWEIDETVVRLSRAVAQGPDQIQTLSREMLESLPVVTAMLNEGDLPNSRGIALEDFSRIWSSIQAFSEGFPPVDLSRFDSGAVSRDYRLWFIYAGERYFLGMETIWIPFRLDPSQNCVIPLPECHPVVD